MDLFKTYSAFDAVFLLLLTVFAIVGLFKGLVHQLIGLATIIAGTYFSHKFALVATDLWHGDFDKKAVYVVFFVVFLILICILAFRLSKILKKILGMIPLLNWINRLCGMLFGAIQILMVFCTLAYFIDFFKLGTIETVSKSKTYPHLVQAANMIFQHIK